MAREASFSSGMAMGFSPSPTAMAGARMSGGRRSVMRDRGWAFATRPRPRAIQRARRVWPTPRVESASGAGPSVLRVWAMPGAGLAPGLIGGRGIPEGRLAPVTRRQSAGAQRLTMACAERRA